jgi:hypothetical protein
MVSRAPAHYELKSPKTVQNFSIKMYFLFPLLLAIYKWSKKLLKVNRAYDKIKFVEGIAKWILLCGNFSIFCLL